MTVRAKMVCVAVSATSDESARVVLTAVTAETPENKTWSKYTPWAEFTLSITNPAAIEAFKTGQEYFIDIAPVDPAT